MLAKRKLVKVGVDLDGVVAKHAMRGFWVSLRKLKEFFLKKSHSSNYYYPSTEVEKLGWKVINSARLPFDKKGKDIKIFLKENRLELYLITSRFKFLEKLTYLWLKKYRLDHLFTKVIINNKNQNPLIFKLNTVKKLNLDCLIDDDFEVIQYLKDRTDKKLFWVNIHYDPQGVKKFNPAIVCKDFTQALEEIIKIL